MGAVFDQLNKKGESGATDGLKHVTNDMKTKNRPPEERAKGLEPKQKQPAPTAAAKSGAKPKGPAKCALVGTKWVVVRKCGF